MPTPKHKRQLTTWQFSVKQRGDFTSGNRTANLFLELTARPPRASPVCYRPTCDGENKGRRAGSTISSVTKLPVLFLFLRQNADKPTPKHRRQLITWQIFWEEISQPGIEPPTSSLNSPPVVPGHSRFVINQLVTRKTKEGGRAWWGEWLGSLVVSSDSHETKLGHCNELDRQATLRPPRPS